MDSHNLYSVGIGILKVVSLDQNLFKAKTLLSNFNIFDLYSGLSFEAAQGRLMAHSGHSEGHRHCKRIPNKALKLSLDFPLPALPLWSRKLKCTLMRLFGLQKVNLARMEGLMRADRPDSAKGAVALPKRTVRTEIQSYVSRLYVAICIYQLKWLFR